MQLPPAAAPGAVVRGGLSTATLIYAAVCGSLVLDMHEENSIRDIVLLSIILTAASERDIGQLLLLSGM